MLVILRMNRALMEFMRTNYPELAHSLGKQCPKSSGHVRQLAAGDRVDSWVNNVSWNETRGDRIPHVWCMLDGMFGETWG